LEQKGRGGQKEFTAREDKKNAGEYPVKRGFTKLPRPTMQQHKKFKRDSGSLFFGRSLGANHVLQQKLKIDQTVNGKEENSSPLNNEAALAPGNVR